MNTDNSGGKSNSNKFLSRMKGNLRRIFKGKSAFTIPPAVMSFKFVVEDQKIHEVLPGESNVEQPQEDSREKSSKSSKDSQLSVSENGTITDVVDDDAVTGALEESDQRSPALSSIDTSSCTPIKVYFNRLGTVNVVKRSISLDQQDTATGDVNSAAASSSSSFSAASTSEPPWTNFFSEIKGKITKTVEGKFEEIRQEHKKNKITRKKSQSSSDENDLLFESSVSSSSSPPPLTLHLSKDVDIRDGIALTATTIATLTTTTTTTSAISTTSKTTVISGNVDNVNNELSKNLKKAAAITTSVGSGSKLSNVETTTTMKSYRNLLDLDEGEIENATEAIKLKNDPAAPVDHQLQQDGHRYQTKCVKCVHLFPRVYYDLLNFLWIWKFGVAVVVCTLAQLFNPSYTMSFILGILFACRLLPLITGLGNFFAFNDYEGSSAALISNRRKNKTCDSICTDTCNDAFSNEMNRLMKIDSQIHEGWMNEFACAEYTPEIYHFKLTESVYINLKGHKLRILETLDKIPKRAFYDEPCWKAHFTRERSYNLLNCSVTLLPDKLVHKRKWSKKYPICITLTPDAFLGVRSHDNNCVRYSSRNNSDNRNNNHTSDRENVEIEIGQTEGETHSNRKLIEIFKKHGNDKKSNLSSKIKTTATDINRQNTLKSTNKSSTELRKRTKKSQRQCNCLNEDDSPDHTKRGTNFSALNRSNDSPNIYLFARTDREKELWFRRLLSATRCTDNDEQQIDAENESTKINEDEDKAKEYLCYLREFFQSVKVQATAGERNPENKIVISEDNIWLNVFSRRLFYDIIKNKSLLSSIQDKLQRKLDAIHLPRFLESLTVRDIEFGDAMPLIQQVSQPIIDEKGIWFDLQVTVCGLFRIAIDTKINLMKTKKDKIDNNSSDNNFIKKSAIYDSDIEDSAETSADESELKAFALDYLAAESSAGASNHTNTGIGYGSSSGAAPAACISSLSGNKVLRMVDKFTSTKFFESVMENKYIKKMMENVSNTELILFVELKRLSGTLVLNIPPPPTDRIWYGFRHNPKLSLSAYPKIGDVTFELISRWIQRKFHKEFEKVFVLPNMDDIIIPGFDKA